MRATDTQEQGALHPNELTNNVVIAKRFLTKIHMDGVRRVQSDHRIPVFVLALDALVSSYSV